MMSLPRFFIKRHVLSQPLTGVLRRARHKARNSTGRYIDISDRRFVNEVLLYRGFEYFQMKLRATQLSVALSIEFSMSSGN